MTTTIPSRDPVRFAGPQLDRLFRQFFKLQAIREKASTASPNASPNHTHTHTHTHTLTQQPTSPEPETDKTNSLAPTNLPPAIAETALQTDKTNSPATAAPQADKTNSPATEPPVPAFEAAPQIDKTNSPPPGHHGPNASQSQCPANRQNELPGDGSSRTRSRPPQIFLDQPQARGGSFTACRRAVSALTTDRRLPSSRVPLAARLPVWAVGATGH